MSPAEQKRLALHNAGYRCQARADHGGYCNNRSATVVYIAPSYVVLCNHHLVDGEAPEARRPGDHKPPEGSSSSDEYESPPLGMPF